MNRLALSFALLLACGPSAEEQAEINAAAEEGAAEMADELEAMLAEELPVEESEAEPAEAQPEESEGNEDGEASEGTDG